MTLPLRNVALAHADSGANVRAAAPAPGGHGRKRVSAGKRPRARSEQVRRRSERVRKQRAKEEGGGDENYGDESKEEEEEDVPFDVPIVMRATKRRKATHGTEAQPTLQRAIMPRGWDEGNSARKGSKEKGCSIICGALQSDTGQDAKYAHFSPACTTEDSVVRSVLGREPAVARDASRGDVSEAVREVLVDWLMEVSNEYMARAQTLALSVTYLDRVLAGRVFPHDDLQLVAVVCMLIACKIEEEEPPSMSDVVFICDHVYSRRAVVAMEEIVLNELEFRLTAPTHMSIVQELTNRAGLVDHRMTEMQLAETVQFTSMLALLHRDVSRRGAGVMALACVLVVARVQHRNWADVGEDVVGRMWAGMRREAAEAAQEVFDKYLDIRVKHDKDESRYAMLKWPEASKAFGDPSGYTTEEEGRVEEEERRIESEFAIFL